MRAWSGVVGGLVLTVAACGQSVGTAGVDRRGATEGQGAPPAPDGGQAVCEHTPPSLVNNAGGGSACGRIPTLGTPVSVTTSVPDGGVCVEVGPSDGEGSWVIDTLEPNGTAPFPTSVWRSHRRDGGLLAQASFFNSTLTGGIGPPLASGWFEVELTGNFQAAAIVRPYSATLEPQADRDDPRYYFGYPGNFVPAPGGGMAGVGPPKDPGAVTCTGDDVPLRLAGFGPTGGLTASADLGCVNPAGLTALAANASGDVMFLDRNQGWTLHATGELTSFPFPPGDAFTLFPLADGRFALKNDVNHWEATLSPSGVLGPPPCWLTARKGVTGIQLVQSGTAYLLRYDPESFEGAPADCQRYLEYVLLDGTGCGFVSVDGPRVCSGGTVTVGVDGTLATLDDAACTVRTWPAAFGPFP